MQGVRTRRMRSSLPYGGINRVRFIGYNLSRSPGTPACGYVCPGYRRDSVFIYFSVSRISYSFGQYFPVR